jgi:methylamine---glutamate N-methyltransferase subunit C
VTGLSAPGFPERAVRARARGGAGAVFPPLADYGTTVFGQAWAAGAGDPAANGGDLIDESRLVPPVFMPQRLEKLIDLGREPLHGDVDLRTRIGGFDSALPLCLSAFGSTTIASTDLGLAAGRQAARLGIPMVIGENIVPMNGYRGAGAPGGGADGSESASPLSGGFGRGAGNGLLERILGYAECARDGLGGVIVQQSADDADAEVWNLVYSDPRVQPLLESGRLGFELKVGQGAKPGLGGMTVLGAAAAAGASAQYSVEPVFGEGADRFLRCGSPGTFTAEILSRQIQLMRNNFPRARVWVKLHPGRDVGFAAATAWRAGADAVAVDGAEGGSGWAPTAFLDQVGLPLADCLLDLRAAGPRPPAGSLLVSGRVWEGGRVAKCLALGATAASLGRAALIAVDEDPEHGLIRLAAALELELRLLISALGKYRAADLDAQDVRLPRWAGRGSADPALAADVWAAGLAA